MRTAFLLAIAAMALASCQKAANGKDATAGASPPNPTAGAVATALPTRKAGLWEQTMSHDGAAGPMGSMKICVDATTDAQMSLFGERMKGKSDCQRSVNHGLDGSYSYSSTCQMGQSGTITSKGTVTGDFNSGYKVLAENDISGAAISSMNGHHVMEIDGSYKGPCPAGMTAGDMTLANGMTINVAKMAAAGARP